MLISVYAKPSSSLNKIALKGGVIHIKLKTKPIDGEANAHLIKLIAHFFEVPPSQIILVKGLKSKRKIIDISISKSLFDLKISQLN